MKRIASIVVALVVAASAALGHGGHEHSFLGTVKAVTGNELSITTREGVSKTFVLTEKTRFEMAKKPAQKSALVAGARVSVEVENDGKTAVLIRIGKVK